MKKLTLSFLALLASGQLLFSQANNFPATGNVGIATGTATVPYPLTVYSTTSSLALFKTTSATNSAITVENGTGNLNLGVGATTPHPYAYSTTGSFMIGADGGPTVFVKGMSSGLVGINTITPGFNLDVNGSMHTNNILIIDQPTATAAAAWFRGPASQTANMIIQGGNLQAWWFTGGNGVLNIGGNGGTQPTTGVLNIDYLGNSAFGGNTASNYKLDVYGNLRANEVVVNTTGADYVFDTAYRLPSLQSLDKYIHAHHHLPDIAPASEMQEQGLSVGENQTVLLKKIEELSLYIIEQNKKSEELSQHILDQDKKMAKMQDQLDKLKAVRQ